MKQFLLFSSLSIFSIFIGSQITEGVLLVPYWQSLSSTDFYSYYNEFGPLIGRFYTVLTIIAALIPIVVSYLLWFFDIKCKSINAKALKFALISSFFALLFVASFYLYFKDTNALFYQAAFNEFDLKKELIVWSYWHWARVFVECLSLVFLIFTLNEITETS